MLTSMQCYKTHNVKIFPTFLALVYILTKNSVAIIAIIAFANV